VTAGQAAAGEKPRPADVIYAGIVASFPGFA
jgi:hypothetical protein